MKKFLLILFIVSLAIISWSLYYSFYVIDEVQTIFMDIEIAAGHGFNLDTDMMHFGKTVPGGMSFRLFNVTNNKDYLVEVKIVRLGKLGEWTLIKDQDFFVEPHSTKEIKATVYPPPDTEYGKYEGALRIIIKRG